MLYNNMYETYDRCHFPYYHLSIFKNNKPKTIARMSIGDITPLEIELNLFILIDNNDIVFDVIGGCPLKTTEGDIGSKAYNTVELRSWELVGITNNNGSIEYLWKEDKVFKYNLHGYIPIYLPDEYYIGKQVKIDFYNFRYEVLYSITQQASKEIVIEMTEDLLKNVFTYKGTYSCKVTILDEEGNISTVILPSNYEIIVK